MSIFYMLDTNVIVDAIRRKHNMATKLASYSPQEIGLASMTLAELEFGVLKAGHQPASRRSTDRLIAELAIVPFNSESALIHARLQHELRGRQIGKYDLIIAATALACKAVLVTADTSEFSRVPGLIIENWRAN